MAAAVAIKASMPRSKSSLHSLSLQASPKTATSGTCMGLRPMKKFPSPLYLQDLSSPSMSSMKPTLHRQASSLSCGTCSDEESMNATSTDPTVSDGSNLIQWAVLVAFVFHVPNLLEEIYLILDLHYHSFPMLVVLGSFPLFLKRSMKKTERIEDVESYSKMNDFSFRSTEMLYRTESSLKLESQSETFPEIIAREGSTFSDTDDWGHFAELDETMIALERNLSFKVPSRQTALSTLEEAEEEE
eukprot:scaffold7415_cov170-Amphora_coffeaeformis.AAC.12